jgi:hypothetical protein
MTPNDELSREARDTDIESPEYGWTLLSVVVLVAFGIVMLAIYPK